MRKSGCWAMRNCLCKSCRRVHCKRRIGRSAFTVACRDRIFDVFGRGDNWLASYESLIYELCMWRRFRHRRSVLRRLLLDRGFSRFFYYKTTPRRGPRRGR